MTQMADKDRLCTPLRFLPSTPDCFQFSELHQDGGSRERLQLREEEEMGRVGRGG